MVIYASKHICTDWYFRVYLLQLWSSMSIKSYTEPSSTLHQEFEDSEMNHAGLAGGQIAPVQNCSFSFYAFELKLIEL